MENPGPRNVGLPRAKQFTPDERLIYRLGFMNAEAATQHKLQILQTANARLWEQLVALDHMDPIVKVELSVSEAAAAINMLRRGSHVLRARVAHTLEQKLRDACEIRCELLDERILQDGRKFMVKAKKKKKKKAAKKKAALQLKKKRRD